MGAVLKRSVVTGGVVYPAGTAATPALVERITNADLWDGSPTAEDESEKAPETPARRTRKAPAKSED